MSGRVRRHHRKAFNTACPHREESATNLKAPRDFGLEGERLGDALKAWVAVDRRAAEAGGDRLLDIVGAGMAPEAASNARN